MATLYYDLTELFRAERSRMRYYGIARVVAEIAYELNDLRNDIVWVVFDEVEQRFLRVEPKFGMASLNGLVGLDLPKRAFPMPMHGARDSETPLRRAAGRVANLFSRVVNDANRTVRERYLKPLELAEGDFFTAARPKLVVGMLNAVKATSAPTRVHVMVHDCFALHDYEPSPNAFQVNARDDLARVVVEATQLIANSHFTRRDIREKSAAGLLPPPIDRFAVVQLAHECRPDGAPAMLKLPQRPYVLGVGLTLGRKNLEVVLEALRLIVDRKQTPPLLVLAGAMRQRTWRGLFAGKFRDVRRHVQLVTSPPQPDLIALYQHALATVLPSRLEGWGLPVGESLWLGTPAIAAPNSSLVEAGLDVAEYVDPDAPEQMADILMRLKDDPAYHPQMVARVIAAKPRLRSWSQVATELLTTIDSFRGDPRT